MLCPKCGAKNNAGAKFCKSCGSALGAPNVAQPAEEEKAEVAKPEAPKVEDAKAAEPQAESKPTADKGADAKAKLAAMPKKTKLIIGGVAAVVIVAIIAVVMFMNNGPSDSTIEEFVRQSGVEQSVPASDTWEDKSGFTIQSVKVLEKSKSDGGTQSAIVMGVQMSDPYTAKVEVVLSNGSTEVTEQATMYLAKVNGEWDPLFFSKSSFSVTSVNLVKGVSHKKVAKHMETVLGAIKKTGERSLIFMYEDGSFKVTKDSLDADKKTDTLTIECTANNPCFEARGTVTATFEYGDNGWEFKSAKADKDLENLSYQKLVGSWTGTLEDYGSYNGDCNGGKTSPAKLNITSVDQQAGKVDGTVTVLMHFHEKSDVAEESDPGDAVIADIPFSVVFDFSRDYMSYSRGFDYERDEDSSGDVRIELCDDALKVYVGSDYTGGSKAYSWYSYDDEYTMTKDN